MHTITRDTMVDGRYRAVKRLGSGGMAEVWCVEDEVLGRRVALKLLGGRFVDDPEFRERFRREARAAAGLAHPNIVGIYDRSEWDGVPYIAMELVDGKTLKELVAERGPLPPDVAIAFTEQILRALAYAHRRGIVHRDVKPQNVIIDAEGQAKVADFGIARAADSEMTQTGTIVGTVQYLSPEQAEGRPVDHRSDLYSTGIVLYELLTGQVPFDGEAPIAIAIKQINEPPVPPGQLEPGIPPALEAVVMRALEKDPERRFQSADEFIGALENARRAPSRAAAPARAVEEPRTRWWIWALVALALAAVGVGIYFLTVGNRVTVPNLVGREASEVDPILERRGLQVQFESRESDDVPRDEVISQDPAAGEEVREGSTVNVVISGGPGEVPVPAVEGESRQDAQRTLEDAGFKVAVEEAFSNSVDDGNVISTSPEGGEQLTKGRTVTMRVSKGAEGIAVPKVVGLQQDEAEAQLESAGLRSEATEQETTQPPGTVMQQDPSTGTRVDRGATVQLTVAAARPEVPDVTTGNPTAEEATTTLEEAGFKVQTREREDPGQVGRVVDQSPAAGESRSSGATITIFVGADAAAADADADADAHPGMRVAVLAGGRSSEHEVSLNSAAAVRAGVAAAGHDVLPVTIERAGAWIHEGAELALRPGQGLAGADVVFPVLHGPFGEDGTLQGLLELLDVPYVGAGVLASSLCMDKVVFKEVLAAADVPQVPYRGVRVARWRAEPKAVERELAALGTPVFVKPARLGSSVGIAKVGSESELAGALDAAFAHDGHVIVEGFSAGLEVECSVLGNETPEASIPGEIVLTGSEWYDYEAKYQLGGMELVVPARLGAHVLEAVRRLAVDTFLRVGCAGLARVDFFVEDSERVLVNELNTLPGFTATSVYPKLWEATGLAFPDLCDRLLGLALERFEAERSVAF